MRLPTASKSGLAQVLASHGVGQSVVSDSAASELTIANVSALNQAYPARKATDHLSSLPSFSNGQETSKQPVHVAQATHESLPERRSPLISTSHTLTSATLSSALIQAVAEVDLNSSVSSLNTTLVSDQEQPTPAGLSLPAPSLKVPPLPEAVSMSDVTGSYADEDFQAGMAALDAGIERLRQQLHTCQS